MSENLNVKKIGFFLMTDGDGIGGAWALFLEYLDWLDRKNFLPVVFYYCRNKETDKIRREHLAARNVNVITLNASGVPLECESRMRLPAPVRFMMDALRMASYIKKQHLHAVHFVLGWYPSHQLPIIASALAHVKVRLSDILLPPGKSHQGRKFQTIINFLADKSPTHVRSMSQRDIEVISRNTFIDRSKIQWILPSVNIDLYAKNASARVPFRNDWGISGEQRLFLSIGRLAAIKAPLEYVQAIAQVADLARDHHARFLLVGNGSLFKELKNEINKCHIDDIVQLTGYLPDNISPMVSADVFVNHSIAEGGPMTFLEALAAGKPVLSTDVGFTTEIIEETRCGFTVPTKNTASLSEALKDLILMPDDKLHEISRRGYEFAAVRLGADEVKAQFLNIYLSKDNDGNASAVLNARQKVLAS